MNKELRMNMMRELVSEGHGRSEIFSRIKKECPDITHQQLLWDWQDSDAASGMASRKKLKLGEEPGIEDHLDIRATIYNESIEQGNVSLALSAVQDMSKLQGMYVEKRVSDSTVVFKFEFEPTNGYRPSIPGASAPILTIPHEVVDGND